MMNEDWCCGLILDPGSDLVPVSQTGKKTFLMQLLIRGLLSGFSLVLVSGRVSSVHQVGCAPAQVRLLGFLEGELDSCQPDQEDVQCMEEEDEEEEPEAAIVALAVRLEDEVDLVEVGDLVGEVTELHLRRKQDHHQTAAQTCRTDLRLVRVQLRSTT